jgi:hypothetical protein
MGFFDSVFGDGDSGSGDELSQQDYSGKNFAGRNLQGKEISQCEFKRTVLTNAIFVKATVTQCDFSGADLRGTRWEGADVTQCNFAGAMCDGMVTTGASFSQCENLPPWLYGKFDDIDDDAQKWQLAGWKLGQLQQIEPSGSVKERRDDDKLWFSGTYNGRPFRIVVDISYGTMELEMKARTQRGDLTVFFDREAQPKPPAERDEVWDSDASSQQFFIGPGVYIEDDAQELERQKQMFWGEMPRWFAQFMPAGNATRVRVDNGNLIEISFKDDILAGDLTYRVKNALDFASAVAQACGG